MSVQASPEVVVARLRSHGRAMFWPSLALVADAAALGYLVGRVTEGWERLVVVAGAAVLAVLLFLLPLVAWLGRNYTITTRRIVLRRGLAVRIRQEVLHSRGYDVTLRQAGLQQLFGSGDVIVGTGPGDPAVLRDVPRARLVQEALHDLMEQSSHLPPARR